MMKNADLKDYDSSFYFTSFLSIINNDKDKNKIE